MMDIVIVINKQKKRLFAEWYYSLIVLIISRKKERTNKQNIVIMLFAHYFLPPSICMINLLATLCDLTIFYFIYLIFVNLIFLCLLSFYWLQKTFRINAFYTKEWCMLAWKKNWSNLPLWASMSAFSKKNQVLVKRKCRFNIVPWSSFLNPPSLTLCKKNKHFWDLRKKNFNVCVQLHFLVATCAENK